MKGKYLKNLILGLIALLLFPLVLKSEVVTINDSTKIFNVGEYVEILEDKTGRKSFEDIIHSKEFNSSKQKIPNLGVSPSTFWIKLKVKNNIGSKILLEIDHPILDEVSLYYFSSQGELVSRIISEYKPFDLRKYKSPSYIFEVEILKNATATIFIKIQSNEQIIVPISLGAPEVVQESITNKEFIIGIYVGIMGVMILYNLFIYIITQDVNYFNYVIYVFLIAGTQLTLKGYSFKYLWPNLYYFNSHALTIWSSLVGLAAIYFIQTLLNTKKNTPLFDIILRIFICIFIVSTILSITGKIRLAFIVMQLNTLFASLGALTVIIKLAIMKVRQAKFLLLAWSVLLIGSCIYILRDYEILPYNSFTNYSILAASSIETILLSFALADRINILKRENERKQSEIITHLQSKEKYLLAWKEASINAEKLKKESMAAQFETLKNQVNPHFLFNSLNFLTELLYQDQDQAAEFIKELSMVYRYVLENKEKEVVCLDSEVEILNSFTYLLKIRFHNNIIIDNKLPKKSEILIAPLTLQLLVENAIKHNIASSENPLVINLFVEKKFVIVTNKIQRKNSFFVSSFEIGLKNIQKRYEFLTNVTVEVIDSGNDFIVKVPVLLNVKDSNFI